jgi:hypothetical protein
MLQSRPSRQSLKAFGNSAKSPLDPPSSEASRLLVLELAMRSRRDRPPAPARQGGLVSLHWVMDMIFRDDECRIRANHAPANFTTLKHMAHNLIRKAPGKDSFRLKRKVAAWDDDFLASLIAA